VVVVMLAVAVDLIGLHVWSYRSGLAYQDARFSAARQGYEGQMSVAARGPETWVADYNLGTTLLAQGWLDTGVRYLERANERVPRAKDRGEGDIEAYSYECRVRTNLALGVEAQGDVLVEEGAWSDAAGLFERSSTLLEPCQSDDGAQPPSGQSQSGAGGGEDPGEQAGSAKDRADQKAQDARDHADGREPSGSGSDQGNSGSDQDDPEAQDDPGAAPTPDPFPGESEAERRRREELENRLNGSNSDQQDTRDQNRSGTPNGGW